MSFDDGSIDFSLPANQLTKKELKEKLKHIAGLCYALCCDVSRVEIEAENLREEKKYLKEENARLRGMVSTPPPTQKPLNSEYLRKKAAERRKEIRTEKHANETPEQRETRLAKQREINKRVREKQKAKKAAQIAAQKAEGQPAEGKPENNA